MGFLNVFKRSVGGGIFDRYMVTCVLHRPERYIQKCIIENREETGSACTLNVCSKQLPQWSGVRSIKVKAIDICKDVCIKLVIMFAYQKRCKMRWFANTLTFWFNSQIHQNNTKVVLNLRRGEKVTQTDNIATFPVAVKTT